MNATRDEMLIMPEALAAAEEYMLRFLTAGESHGPGLTVIVEGLPRGIPVTRESLGLELARRRRGYGRGPRARNEEERIELMAGIRAGLTTGAPISVLLRHSRWDDWRPLLDAAPQREGGEVFAVSGADLHGVTAAPSRPRPGHADLAGAIKYGLTDLRDVIERASARETAARTVAGTMARSLLHLMGIEIGSCVISVGPITAEMPADTGAAFVYAESSPLRTIDPRAEQEMMAAIDRAKADGDTLGGVFLLIARGVPAGLGSYTQWDRRLDARLAGALMSIPSVKGVACGDGFALAALPGSAAHDEILRRESQGYVRGSNHAGGLEGGLSNGEPIVLRGAVKPVPTLYKPLASIDLKTGQSAPAAIERSDVCVVPAAAVVAEAMTAWVLAEACLEKFGGDTVEEFLRSFRAYQVERS